jgi:hypothetical protein
LCPLVGDARTNSALHESPKKLIAALTAICAIIWILTAIHPVDRSDMAAAFLGAILSVIGLSLWHRKMDH